MAATFDSNSNKVVIAFTDNQDAAGESVVGTVSGTSISFGSEVQFESFSIDFPSVTFDSNLNKVVIVYRDAGNLTHGKSIVEERASSGGGSSPSANPRAKTTLLEGVACESVGGAPSR